MLTAGHPIGLVVVSTDHDYIIRITLPIAGGARELGSKLTR